MTATRGSGMGQWAPARVRGLQKPYSRDQLAAMCLYPVLTGAFYILVGFYLPKRQLPPVLVVYCALVVVVVWCWAYVEMVDPSKPGGIPCLCMKYTQSNSRYCANCRKTVPGLDHHCLWLNTCIGTRNYFFFFVLAVSGTLQFAFQAVISVLMLTLWYTGPVERVVVHTVRQPVFYEVFMIVHTVAAGAAMLGFGSLCVFHGYLQALGMGTYDWVLSKRDYNNNTAPTAPARRTQPPAPSSVAAQQQLSSVLSSPAPGPLTKDVEMGSSTHHHNNSQISKAPPPAATATTVPKPGSSSSSESQQAPNVRSASPQAAGALSDAENGHQRSSSSRSVGSKGGEKRPAKGEEEDEEEGRVGQQHQAIAVAASDEQDVGASTASGV